MSNTKLQREVLDKAKSRGWTVLRTGAHNQSILVHPPTGARMTLWSSPRSTPSVKQIVTRMAGLERSTRLKRQRDILNWVCAHYGIGDTEGRVVKCSLKQLAEQYLGKRGSRSEAEYHRATQNAAGDLASSDRVWLMEKGRKGEGQMTLRLICGGQYLMTHAEQELVESVHQVNGVFFEEKRNGVVPVEGETEPAFKTEPLPLVRLAEPTQAQQEQSARVAKTVERIYGEETRGKSIDLPQDLADALRAHLGIDNSETIEGLAMVEEALTNLERHMTTVVPVLIEEVREALSLVRVAK